jgi:hypothetical protein
VKLESDWEEIQIKIEDYPAEERDSDSNVLKFTERYIRRLEEFYRKYPEHRQPLEARYGNLKQRDLAQKYKISDRAIRKRIDKAENDLKKWLAVPARSRPPKSSKKK